jgi:hypothetical protein
MIRWSRLPSWIRNQPSSLPLISALIVPVAISPQYECVQRVNAGLARARANGTKLGRRRVKPSIEERIKEVRKGGMGILKIGREVGVGTSVVQRVLT